jgi:Ca2+ transporting ATPase
MLSFISFLSSPPPIIVLFYNKKTHYRHCTESFPEIGCEMFLNNWAKRGSTMSLSILVTIEMLNALNK